MKRCLLALLFLAACEGGNFAANPVVSDFNGASVKIQVFPYATREAKRAAADPEATRICRQGGKRRAEYASETFNSQTGINEFLYLCLN